MEQRTTIAIPAWVRDRLREYGRKSDSYATILNRLMDLIAPSELEQAGVPSYTRTFTEAEVRKLRTLTATQKLRLAEGMRLLPLQTRVLAARRTKRT